MAFIGKNIQEIRVYINNESLEYGLIKYDSVNFKDIAKNEYGKVVRLKYDEYIWSMTRAEYEYRTITHWLVMKNDVVKSVYSMKRTALTKINIIKKPVMRQRVVRDNDAFEFDKQICKDADEYGEKGGWCGIRAFCNITKTSFIHGREKCKKYGWTHHGMYTSKLIELLRDEGYTVTRVTSEIREHCKTVKTFEKHGWDGVYLILVKGHFVSSVNGTITDYSYGMNLQLRGVWRITKNN